MPAFLSFGPACLAAATANVSVYALYGFCDRFLSVLRLAICLDEYWEVKKLEGL
jgi:hypothetical protein